MRKIRNYFSYNPTKKKPALTTIIRHSSPYNPKYIQQMNQSSTHTQRYQHKRMQTFPAHRPQANKHTCHPSEREHSAQQTSRRTPESFHTIESFHARRTFAFRSNLLRLENGGLSQTTQLFVGCSYRPSMFVRLLSTTCAHACRNQNRLQD